MNAPLSIAFNPLAEADQLHAARSVMVKLRDNAAGRWAQDAYSDCVVLLDQAIENEADERGETINAGYVDYRHDLMSMDTHVSVMMKAGVAL